MARTLDQVAADIAGNFIMQIARLTVITEEQSDKIKALETENAELKTGNKNG